MSKKSKSGSAVRAIDHAVLPVSTLSQARNRLESLGFTVAADARHPFGTENCCVYLADGTFLEPLAVARRELIEASARNNVFTARDQVYRFRRGEEGFSALAFASEDAAADHKAFKRAGISAGRKLPFSRRFTGADGKQDKASFLLAFAADPRAPDAFFFACQRVQTPDVDRLPLQAHANGALGISAVVLSEPQPSDFLDFMRALTRNGSPECGTEGIEIALPNANVQVLSPEGLQSRYGIERRNAERGIQLEGLVVKVRSLDILTDHLDKREIAYHAAKGLVVVGRASGQGAFLAFSE